MFKSLIVSAILGAAALGGSQYYFTGVVPFLDTPPAPLPAASAPAYATPAPLPAASVTYAAPAPAYAAVSAPAPTPAPVAACGAPIAPTPTPTPAAAPASAGGLVSLNTATDAELDTLPDTGTARIRHIHEARARGPIRSVEDLRGPGMPDSYLSAIRPYVSA